MTPDELQRLREELLGEAVEEAAVEEEQGWVSFQDAEEESV